MSNWEWWKPEEPKQMKKEDENYFTMEQYEQERGNTVSISHGGDASDILWDSGIDITGIQLREETPTVDYANDIVYDDGQGNIYGDAWQQELDLQVMEAKEVPDLRLFFTELDESIRVTVATNGFVVRVSGCDGERDLIRTFILQNISQVAEMFETARKLVKDA